MALDAGLQRAAEYAPRYVTVTGGEPLAQRGCVPLLAALCDAGYRVSLETSGALDVSGVDPRVTKVMDFKTPASGEAAKNRLENIAYLGAGDQVKFVICDEADYLWARDRISELGLSARFEILLSPALGQQNPSELADWIIRDRLQVRFQIQLHKFLWGDVAGK